MHYDDSYDDSPVEVRSRRTVDLDDYSDDPVPGGGYRWSTWDDIATPRGPEPYPDWLVTELAAVDIDYGVLKTGKEADVFLVAREVPDTDRSCLLASKRYRDPTHRQFHRDSAYQEGRKTRKSRDARALKNRSAYGRQVAAGHWAWAEFDALCQLHRLGAEVPYPVQLLGTELLLEFIGSADGVPAPRLVEVPHRGAELTDLWEQAVHLLYGLAAAGYAHGDLSPYNLLVDGERLVVIDLPQLVDLVANPQGPSFLDRDVVNVATWFVARGLSVDIPVLVDDLRAEARIR